MCRVPRILAAAFLGAIPTGLLFAGSAFTSKSQEAAPQATLQVAPRAPFEANASVNAVTVTPAQPLPPACNLSSEGDSCQWSFQPGSTVQLTASAANGSFQFAGWSTSECPGTGSCTLKLDDDYTSIVALFSPLRLGVRFSHPAASDPPPDRHVTSSPPGIDCAPTPVDPTGEGNPGCTHDFPPNTDVELTVDGAGFSKWVGGQNESFCVPETARKCVIRVDDYTSWAGAVYDNEDPPQLAQTIQVRLQIRKGGSGSGTINAQGINCGSACSAEFLYGKFVTLTETATGDSVFDGWNGVCARTQRTCRFPVGPITRVKAQFARDATPPSAPRDLRLTARTRTSISLAWTASSDNLGVKGYRVYLGDAPVADVAATQYTRIGLACGRTYDVAVDAVDQAGNRSQKARIDARTKLCALLARLVSVRVVQHGRSRTVVVRLRSNRSTSARLTLKRGKKTVAARRYKVHAGTNPLRLSVRRSVPAGNYRLRVAVSDPDGGRTRVLVRRVRLKSAR